MRFYGIIQGFCRLLPLLSVQSTSSLVLRSLTTTTLHKPQVPKATAATHALNDPKAVS